MIADVILDCLQLEGREEDGVYRPRPSSSDPEKCLRQMDYNKQGYPKQELQGRAYSIFNDGNFHEELSIDLINKTPYRHHSSQMTFNIPAKGLNVGGYFCKQCDSEVPSDHIHTHIDGMILDLLDTERLFEHKGINHFSFQKYWSGDLPLGYFAQTSFGLRGLQLEDENINEAVILIKNKNTSAYLEFLVYYDIKTDTMICYERNNSHKEKEELFVYMPRITEFLIGRFLEVEEYAKEKKLHDRPYILGENWQCDYCQWSHICWDNLEEAYALRTETDYVNDQSFNHMCYEYDNNRADEKRAKGYKDLLRVDLIKKMGGLKLKKAVTPEFSVSVKVKKNKSGNITETLGVRKRKIEEDD